MFRFLIVYIWVYQNLPNYQHAKALEVLTLYMRFYCQVWQLSSLRQVLFFHYL